MLGWPIRGDHLTFITYAAGQSYGSGVFAVPGFAEYTIPDFNGTADQNTTHFLLNNVPVTIDYNYGLNQNEGRSRCGS